MAEAEMHPGRPRRPWPIAILLLMAAPLVAAQVGQDPKIEEDPDDPMRPAVLAPAIANVTVGTEGCPSGCIYILGGFDGSNARSTILRYDGEDLSLLPYSLPSGRYISAAATLGSDVFVFGGYRDGQRLTDIIAIRTGQDSITPLAVSMPVGLSEHVAVADHHEIFVLGGSSNDGPVRTIYRFAPGVPSFQQQTEQLPYGMIGHRAVWDGRTIWILGGMRGADFSRDIYRMDPATAKVTLHHRSLPSERAFGTAVWDGQYVYYIGGANGLGPLGQVVRLDPKNGAVEPIATSLDPPLRYAFASVLNHTIYLFGGQTPSDLPSEKILSFRPFEPGISASPAPGMSGNNGSNLGPVAPIEISPAVWVGVGLVALAVPTTMAVLRSSRRSAKAPERVRTATRVATGAALVVRDVRVERDGKRIVDGISLEVNAGTVVCLLGMSGSGKSTFLQALVGLAPARGEIEVGTSRLRPGSIEARRTVGYVPQELQLYENLTPLANLEYFASQYDLPVKEARRRAQALLHELGLEETQSRPLTRLSGGQRRRVSIAASLVHEPTVILLDEPTSGLDFSARKALWDVLGRLARDRGVGILATTHFIDDAERADAVGVVTKGKLVALGPPRQLVRSLPGRGRCVELEFEELRPADRERLRALLAELRRQGLADRAEYQPLAVRYFVKDPAAAAQRLPGEHAKAGFLVRSTRIDDVTLEDVFVYHTGGAK